MTAIGDFERRGSGEPLLLIHGFTASHAIWGPVRDLLARDFEIFVPTLPGHTGGPPLDPDDVHQGMVRGLVAMLDEIGWEQPHVAGFSLGGWLAFELAKLGRARTICAIAPAGAPDAHQGREARRIERSFRRQHKSAQITLSRIDAVCRSRRMRQVAMREMMLHGDRMGAAEAAATIRAFATTPAFEAILGAATQGIEDIARVECPVRIVWGVRDRVLRVRHAAWFQDQLPDASLRLLADAGHVPFWDRPDAVAREIAIGTGLVAPQRQADDSPAAASASR